jgi:hypothetical protein
MIYKDKLVEYNVKCLCQSSICLDDFVVAEQDLLFAPVMLIYSQKQPAVDYFGER